MASITIKNIPDALYEKLKLSASIKHRSINSEMINCLESILMPKRVPIGKRLQRAKRIRLAINTTVDPDEISKAISEGRA